MVAIIDYGMGNVASVQKALNFLKIESAITSDPELIEKSDVIILPGVGSFLQGMKNLKSKGLDVLLTDQVLNKKKNSWEFVLVCNFWQKPEQNPTIIPGLVG